MKNKMELNKAESTKDLRPVMKMTRIMMNAAEEVMPIIKDEVEGIINKGSNKEDIEYLLKLLNLIAIFGHGQLELKKLSKYYKDKF